jgi:hypothetical protein
MADEAKGVPDEVLEKKKSLTEPSVGLTADFCRFCSRSVFAKLLLTHGLS